MAKGNTNIVGTEDNPLDVAIIGGGIAGLYCLYRLLKDKDQFKGIRKIRLFESSDHLGGRIETWSLKRDSSEIGYSPTWDPRHLLGEVKDSDNSPYDETAEYLRAEFGPMRIEPRDQTLLREFLNELGITEPGPGASESLDNLVPFFPYTSQEPESAKFILKEEEAEQKNIMDLLLLGIRRILEIAEVKDTHQQGNELWCHPKANKAWKNLVSQKSFYKHYWKGELLDWINHLEDYDPRLFAEFSQTLKEADEKIKEDKLQKWLEQNSDYYKIRLYFEIDGHPLWDMGFWNLMSDVLSHYAVVKIRDWGSYYHFLHENLNAAEWLVFWLKALKGTHSLRGIQGGMSRIIYALLFKLCELQTRVKRDEPIGESALAQQKYLTQCLARKEDPLIEVQKTLTSIELMDSGVVKLTFNQEGNTHVFAKHVILALPKLPLDKLATPLSQVLRNCDLNDDAQKCEAALASVKCLPLLKCFFILEHPWWHEDRELNAAAADIPTREITYSRSKDKTRGMIMIYTDHPAITFWSDYLREFKQAAEPDQVYYTTWWRDKFVLPPKPEQFDRIKDWKGAWKELAQLWKEKNSDTPKHEIDPDDLNAVARAWDSIQKWWTSMSTREQTDLLHKYYENTKRTAAKNYLQHKKIQQERLWNRFVQFARDYEHHDFLADHLLACGIHDWGKAPFGAAAHGWLPGEKSRDHIEYLAAFPENGQWKGKIHICGEAFSDYQGFIEGSLRSVEEALCKIRESS